MNRFNLALRAAMALSLSALLAACGGGVDSASDGARAFAAQMSQAQSQAATPSVHTLSVSTLQLPTTVSTEQLLDWAEYKYANLFPKGAQSFSLAYDGKNFTVRAYPAGRYLGVTTEGAIYGLGDFTNDALQSYGVIADWASQVTADGCSVYPGSCTPTGGGGASGALNGCIAAPETTLTTGNSSRSTTVSTSAGNTSQSTVENLVEGAATFEGNSAIAMKSTITTSSTVNGTNFTSVATGRNYHQLTNGLIVLLGAQTDVSSPSFIVSGVVVPGTTSTIKVVYTPGDVINEYTLSLGQSLMRTATVTTTTLSTTSPVKPPPSKSTSTRTFTYQARESINVQGRTWDTCRYTIIDSATPNTTTTNWAIFGLGFSAKSISVSGAQTTSTSELTSLTINGQPR